MRQVYKLSRTYRSAADTESPEVVAVAHMFGIGLDAEHEVVLYHELEVAVATGHVILLTGESGAGKSSLLRDIAAAAAADFSVITLPKIEDLPDRPTCTLFESLEQALELFGYTGLSEAFVMLRKPRELSDGQRYRLTIAMAMAEARKRENAVVVMDEFLANLDRVTARGVAHAVRRVATRSGLCFVVATTHQDIVEDLNANQTVTMEGNQAPAVERRIIA